MTTRPSTEVDSLMRAIGSPPEGSGLAESIGPVGAAWLTLFRRGERGVDAGFARVHDAIVEAPEGANRVRWCLALGLGYGIRAECCRAVSDFDLAIEWLSRILSEPSVAGADREQVAVALIDAHWDRFWLSRYSGQADLDARLGEVDRLVGAMEGLAAIVGCLDANRQLYVTMMMGLTYLERYTLGSGRPDLDRGISRLVEAVPELPSDAARVGLAGAELSNAFRLRAALDDDAGSLDLSIAVGDRTIGRTVDPEPMVWLMLHQTQALAHGMRWHWADDPADLDRAIECWRVLLEHRTGEPPYSWAAAHCGDLLRARGERNGDPVDVAEAITLLDHATQNAPDDPDSWQRWYDLGRAYHAQWRLSHAQGSLEAADRCLARTLRIGVPDDDALLRVNDERMGVAHAVAVSRSGAERLGAR